MSNVLPITKLADLGYDCYPTAPDTLFNDMLARMQVILGSLINGVIISPTRPDPSDRDKAWLDTVDGNIYTWQTDAGDWARQHPEPTTSLKRHWFAGLVADLPTEDGGDANPVGLASGPFWDRDTNWDGKFPLAMGDIPGTSPVVTVAPTDEGGEYEHTLTATESPYHNHLLVAEDTVSGTALTGVNQIAEGRSDDNYVLDGSSKDATQGNSSYFGGNPANSNATDPHNNMPPYRVGFWIKRTIRVWIIAP